MFGRTLTIVILGFIVLAGTSYYFLKGNGGQKVPSENQLAGNKEIIHINNKAVTVEVADERAEQIQGLSGRTGLEENEGMLFVFPEAQIHYFWMKDMNFSLDMIWIDSMGSVIDITKNISPDTFPKTFGPSSPALYVLEVNAGWSDRNNITVGDVVKF
jgi:uncharacterized membrane protein (UPF0127 family)